MKSSQPDQDFTLRYRAETQIGASGDATREEMPPTEMIRLLHELQVHQIELEMQNESLHRSQDALEASRDRYFELFDMAPVGYLTLNDTWHILEANFTSARLLGAARGALLNRSLSSFIPPEDQDIYCLQRTRLAEAAMPQEWNMRMRRVDGSIFWAGLKATPSRNNEYWLVVTDVSEDHELELAENRRHAEQYRAMLATELFGYWLVDTSGKLIDVNDTYCRMSGYSREELLQLTITDLEEAESEEETARHIKQLMEFGVDHFESRHRNKEGWIYCVEISSAFLHSQNCFIVFIRDISDRKIAETELQASEERYHAVVEDQTELICRYKPDGKISFVNDAYLHFYGKKRMELINRNYIPHIPEADLSKIQEQLKIISPSCPIASFEHRVIMSDEAICWQHWVHRGIYTRDGDLLEYQAVGRDISGRKMAEEQLAEQNLFLETLLEATPVPVFFKDRNARYTGFNKAYEEFFGKSRKDLLGKSVYDLAPRELADVYHAKDKELLLNAGSQVYESEARDAKGIMHNVVFHKAAYLNNDNEVGGLVGVVMDITEHRKAMLEMVLNEKRLQLLLELNALPAESEDHILTFTLDACLNTVQSRFAFIGFVDEAETVMTVHKWSEDAMKQCAMRSSNLVLPLAEVGLLGECVRQRVPTVINDYAAPHPRKNGCPVGHVEIKRFLAIPIFNGERIFAVAAVANKEEEYSQVDVDAFTILMEKMTNKILRRRLEEELMQAKNAAEAANRAKSSFLATMSHEIRTPLNALLGNIELLAESELSPQQRERLDDSQTASEMLLQVINDVLDFSKIEAGKLELVNESFSVSEMARNLISTFAAAAEQKGLELALSLADDVPDCICADQHRLHQMIANFFSNAIKFTDHGKVVLEIDTDHSLSGSGSEQLLLLISVRDTGIGIPLNKQGTLFDSFTQVEEFTTRRHTGTGLGLAICRRLAGLMGGSISLTSAPGEGSCFTLSLPVVVCQASKRVKTRRAAVSADTTPRNILLADDEELGRIVTVALLQRRGHRVTAVENGAALLAALQREQFDIVLSDISMPDMDGIEVVRIIRSGQRDGINSRVPMIALTAHAFAEDRTLFLGYGFNDTASKPVDFEGLLRQIDELCGAALSE